MAALKFGRRRVRRPWAVASALTSFALVAVVFVAGSSANLAGSTFEGNDGNLAVNTAGNSDWNSLSTAAGSTPQLNIGTEAFSGQQDNSLGQGAKENDSNVTLVQGSIPPQKSDLTRFYEASETGSNGHVLLYLAWERTNVLGSANMDFEINKQGTQCLNSTGPFPVDCTINRSTGDLLVTYDFTNGGGTPTIGIRTWNGSSWVTPASGTVVAESAVNSGTVLDTRLPAGSQSLVANTFGEASIDLTASGVLTPGTCDFGQATTFLKSRSSASFTSEIKDFVHPIATPISPCASITIIKHTLNASGTRSGVNQSFSYTTSGTGLSGFSLNDATGSDVTCSAQQTNCSKKVFTGLGPGSYSVTESDPSPNFLLTDLSCSASGTGTSVTPNGSSNSTSTASITLAFGGSVTCTYSNQQQTGAIRVTKLSAKGNAALAGASFTYALLTNGSPGTATAFPSATNANGTTCVDGLAFGSYRIAESSAPTGYAKDAGTQDVTVSAAGSCTGGGTVATPTNSFVDTPLSTITVGFHSLAGPGVTSATVQCTDEASAAALPEGDATKTLGNGTSTLTPGTYSCTVVVDP
jgi:hypothetical protein